MTWSIRIQDRALSATNPLRDEGLVKNGIAESDSAGAAQFEAVLVFDHVEEHNATPRFEGLRKLAFCWTPARAQQSSVKCMQAKGFENSYLVHVPDARGSVIPEIASIRDDFPAL